MPVACNRLLQGRINPVFGLVPFEGVHDFGRFAVKGHAVGRGDFQRIDGERGQAGQFGHGGQALALVVKVEFQSQQAGFDGVFGAKAADGFAPSAFSILPHETKAENAMPVPLEAGSLYHGWCP
jgi:hypothetical protein